MVKNRGQYFSLHLLYIKSLVGDSGLNPGWVGTFRSNLGCRLIRRAAKMISLLDWEATSGGIKNTY